VDHKNLGGSGKKEGARWIDVKIGGMTHIGKKGGEEEKKSAERSN